MTSYGKITVEVLRDRNGEFQSPLLPTRKQRVDSLETTIIQLYQRGVTTRQIAELIEQMYGHYYTLATISKITADVSEQVEQFHSRPVSKRYAVIFCDAMYVNLRRDSVAKEAIHVLLGITPNGHKEVLDYAILPSESALNYADMLKSLKKRGLEQVLLFVSDGLVGLSDAVQSEFPRAKRRAARGSCPADPPSQRCASPSCRSCRPSAHPGRPLALPASRPSVLNAIVFKNALRFMVLPHFSL